MIFEDDLEAWKLEKIPLASFRGFGDEGDVGIVRYGAVGVAASESLL